MVFKPGQSGNPNGRPRKPYYPPPDPPQKAKSLADAVTPEQIESLNRFGQKSIYNDYRKIHKSDDYRDLIEAHGLEDPILFQHKLLANNSLPLGLRVAIAANISPYIRSRLGSTAPSRFIETTVQVPDFTTVEEAEAFLASLAQRFGNSELGSQSALDLSTLVRNWISAKHQGEELELKRLAADNNGAEHVIRIEGGLPDLPGTNIIMPSPEGPAIEAETLLGIDRDTVPRDPAVTAAPLPSNLDGAKL
jgi:hypothetical protein